MSSSHVGREGKTGGRKSNEGRCGVDPFDSRTGPVPGHCRALHGVGTEERGVRAAQLAEDIKSAA